MQLSAWRHVSPAGPGHEEVGTTDGGGWGDRRRLDDQGSIPNSGVSGWLFAVTVGWENPLWNLPLDAGLVPTIKVLLCSAILQTNLSVVLQEFLLRRVGPGNIRVKLEPSVAVLNEFDTEEHDGEALTREEIKRQGEEIIAAKTKQKKKKQSTKKK